MKNRLEQIKSMNENLVWISTLPDGWGDDEYTCAIPKETITVAEKAIATILENTKIPVPDVYPTEAGRIKIAFETDGKTVYCSLGSTSLLFLWDKTVEVELSGTVEEKVFIVTKHIQNAIKEIFNV